MQGKIGNYREVVDVIVSWGRLVVERRATHMLHSATVPGRQGRQLCLDLSVYFKLEIRHKGESFPSNSSTSSNYG